MVRSRATSACTSSFWLVTETYSPVPIENAPATRAATPVSTTVCGLTVAPPSPAISEALVTSPSTAPNTVGRSHPPDTSRCPCDHPAMSAAVPVASDGFGVFSSLTYRIPCSQRSRPASSHRRPAISMVVPLRPVLPGPYGRPALEDATGHGHAHGDEDQAAEQFPRSPVLVPSRPPSSSPKRDMVTLTTPMVTAATTRPTW